MTLVALTCLFSEECAHRWKTDGTSIVSEVQRIRFESKMFAGRLTRTTIPLFKMERPKEKAGQLSDETTYVRTRNLKLGRTTVKNGLDTNLRMAYQTSGTDFAKCLIVGPVHGVA